MKIKTTQLKSWIKEEVKKMLNEIKNETKLLAPLRKKINKDLTNLTSLKNKTQYFDNIPLQTISNILEKHGIRILQEDNTKWSGFLMGNSSNTKFSVGYIQTKDNRNIYTPIENTFLILSWHKMSSGRYEIVTYIS